MIRTALPHRAHGRRALLALPAVLCGPARAAEPALDTLLARYVTLPADGIARVDYARWQGNAADLAALDAWTGMAASRRPSAMARAEAFAFWANLYNALTLKVVLGGYPVRSIRDIHSTGVPFDLRQFSGPWRTRLVSVEGRRMSLDDIEHGTMRPLFGDPRVHYAVNCASLGCPNLRPHAWRAATLEADLDDAARAYRQPSARCRRAGRWQAARLLHLPLVPGGFRRQRGRRARASGPLCRAAARRAPAWRRHRRSWL